MKCFSVAAWTHNFANCNAASTMYTMSSSSLATTYRIGAGARLSATIIGLIRVNAGFTGDVTVRKEISTKSTTFASKLIPAEVDLAVTTTDGNGSSPQNTYVDWLVTPPRNDIFFCI